MDLISKIVDLVGELQVITEKNTFTIQIDCWGRQSVHVIDCEKFFEYFETFDINEVKGEGVLYPYELTSEVEGIVFFTLLSEEKHDKYIKKGSVKGA